MWKRWSMLLLAAPAFLVAAPPAEVQTVSLTLEPEQVVKRVDEGVYGQFLEHIYHSVNGGLWEELVCNRSFEEWPKPEGKEPAQRAHAARYWSFYGEGNAFRDPDNPLNSKASQVVVGTGAGAGVAQPHLCVRKGGTNAGSLWARGTAAPCAAESGRSR